MTTSINKKNKKTLSQASRSKLILWLLNGETGISSKTMAAVVMGERVIQDHGMDAPYDPSDFRRCYLLVESIPEIKEFFPEIGKAVPRFKGILESWDKLCLIYHRDKANRSSPELYQLIRLLRGDRIESNNISDIINLKNAGYDVEDLLDKVVLHAKNHKQSMIQLAFNQYKVESFENYFRCGVSYKSNHDAIRKHEIQILIDKDLEFKIDTAAFLKNKSKYEENMAREVLKFIDNGYYPTNTDEQIQNATKVRSYIIRKFPNLATHVKSDRFPEGHSFASLPKTIKPEVRTRKRKAA